VLVICQDIGQIVSVAFIVVYPCLMFIFYLHLHVYVLRVILVPTIDIGASLSVKMAVKRFVPFIGSGRHVATLKLQSMRCPERRHVSPIE
jgi:hypothetical protein